MSVRLALIVACAVLASSPGHDDALLAACQEPGPLIVNGDFAQWTDDGLPRHWQTSLGAQRGDGEESWITPGPGGGVVLEGQSKTRRWQLLSQGFAAGPGQLFRVSFRARAEQLAMEPGQFHSCYVGLSFENIDSQRLGFQVVDVRRAGWTQDQIYGTAPAGAVRGRVMIFLAHTGVLTVRDVKVARASGSPEECFRILVEDMGRHYSYFQHRKIDWPRLARQYERKLEGVSTVHEFIAVIKPMLARLRDLHVTIQAADGKLIPTYQKHPRPNFDHDTVLKRLHHPRRLGSRGRSAYVGRTRDGLGYVAVLTLQEDEKFYRELERHIEPLIEECGGIMIDLRASGGGNELHARRIAAIFADSERVYARSMVRSGPKKSDLAENPPRKIAPRAGATYTRPVVCLIGPYCVSSGEGFAMMMKALPHVKLVGQPTRGASGNPAPIALPNGLRVNYSRWVSMLPDGKVIEGRGLKPDYLIAHRGSGDPTFEKAWQILAKLVDAHMKKEQKRK